jgi:hypothetical protein
MKYLVGSQIASAPQVRSSAESGEAASPQRTLRRCAYPAGRRNLLPTALQAL